MFDRFIIFENQDLMIHLFTLVYIHTSKKKV